MAAPAIARIAFNSEDQSRDVIHNFNSDGFDSLAPKYAGARPAKFTLPERQQIKKIALSRPQDHRLPFSTWPLSKLAEFLVAEGVVDDIGHEGLRLLLRKKGVVVSSDQDVQTVQSALSKGVRVEQPTRASWPTLASDIVGGDLVLITLRAPAEPGGPRGAGPLRAQWWRRTSGTSHDDAIEPTTDASSS